MNIETTNDLTDILTNVSELQTTLLAVPGSGDAMDSLRAIRKAALGVLNGSGHQDDLQGSQRQECLDQAGKLCLLIADHTGQPLPDSTLFRIGAAADNLARMISRYAEMRNHAAATRLTAAPDCLENLVGADYGR